MGGTSWWEPDSFGLALPTALVSTVCWGSWSNTAKATGDRVSFPVYYVDFCLGTLLAAAGFYLGPGRLQIGREVAWTSFLFALGAGGIFGVANLCLTTGIALAGLSVAFPVCIGTGLVLGTTLTYLVDKRGKPEFIFPGVMLALLGVLANAAAYGLHRNEAPAQGAAELESGAEACDNRAVAVEVDSTFDTSASDAEISEDFLCAACIVPAQRKMLCVCVVGGLLMGCWSPLSARSMRQQDGLSPYTAFGCFSVGSVLSSFAVLLGQRWGCQVLPELRRTAPSQNFADVPFRLHLWGLLGGLVWATGTAANLVSGSHLGFALAYALGQTAPVVAVAWGLLWYREFDGAPRRAHACLAAMLLLFAGAIALLALGSG